MLFLCAVASLLIRRPITSWNKCLFGYRRVLTTCECGWVVFVMQKKWLYDYVRVVFVVSGCCKEALVGGSAASVARPDDKLLMGHPSHETQPPTDQQQWHSSWIFDYGNYNWLCTHAEVHNIVWYWMMSSLSITCVFKALFLYSSSRTTTLLLNRLPLVPWYYHQERTILCTIYVVILTRYPPPTFIDPSLELLWGWRRLGWLDG